MNHYLQGLLMGLAYVAPIGLQNLFVINTALTQKKGRVFLTALIVIFFDVTLAFACFFGAGAVMEKSNILKVLILFIGSLIVIYIGYGLLKEKVSMRETEVNISITKVITSACIVTWFNPQAIIDGTMMLGAFRASLPATESMKFILGVTSASCLWFLGISSFISLFSQKFDDKVLRGINLVCGIVIIFYGCKLFYSFIQILQGLV
ncbi:translocator protein, LysE family [Fusobacterium gonidiaformans 3-1-5R]|uniref:Translocator protein, LysE family n=1 Tax=Fusobacterium gonidiaformans 3-1-5R TaxID=469605 RepID=E5BFX5_9FUSO|nr:LysE family transporter [Fusobacterium gonidiaformans]EFS21006.1 translocator protein, LysE family [Fusobacterium gonidiaformans 3-1-5R]